jgi:hypothetical protein
MDEKLDSLSVVVGKLSGRYESDHERILLNESIIATHSKKINWFEGAGKIIIVLIGSISAFAGIYRIFRS